MSQKRALFIYSIVTFCVVGTGLSAPATLQRNQLKVFELKHPWCESQTLVETAKESFTTIANDLPGRNEYNELVKTFHSGNWEKLDKGFEEFSSMFEDSPLREAVAFLRVESLYDRIEEIDSPILKEAEKTLRETLLLYPRSKLIPNIQATVGAFWLRNGRYSQSLALFLKARDENPFHPLSCFFQFGIGETNFLLHEKEAAKKSFTALLQKCNNPRLNVGASLRMMELEGNKSSGPNLKKAEALYNKESNIVRRFYPEALYNLGEAKYQNKDYKSARFFFNEYLDHKRSDPACVPYAQKRLADIAFKLKSSDEEVVGIYLQTYEKNPKTDIGKYSYILAMLMDYPQKSRAEQERRTAVVDEKLTAIQDPQLRYLGVMAKGLALLDAGEGGAIGYLAKATKSNPEDLKTPEMVAFISSKLIKILEREANQTLEQETKKEFSKNEELFSPFEAIFETWIKGTQEEKAVRNFYSDIVTKRIKELKNNGKWGAAFSLLETWKKSSFWSAEEPPGTFKTFLGSQIVAELMSAETGKTEELLKEIEANEETLQSFVAEEFYPVFVVPYLKDKNGEGVTRWMKKIQGARKVASVRSKLPKEVSEFLALKKGEGFISLKKFKEAEDSLKEIRTAKFLESAVLLRIHSLQAIKQYSQAYKVGNSSLSKLPNKDSKIRVLSSLVTVVNDGKMWGKVNPLLVEVKRQKPEPKVLAPFLFLSGKVQAEKKDCKKTIPLFNEALAADASNPMVNEAKFRLAKCNLKEKKKDLAKKQWQEVVDSKDSFWAPLAKSELNLMEEP